MPLFKYQAITGGSEKRQGVISADSLIAAKKELLSQKFVVVNIRPFEQKKYRRNSFPFLLDFTTMLGQLLKSGVPLYSSLVIIEEKYRGRFFHFVFADLCDTMRSGVSFSTALLRHPRFFDPIYIAMVKSGEKTATLGDVFQELCVVLQKQQKLKKQLVAAVAYPAFLGVFSIAIFFFLLIFVIPSVKNLFDGRSLHPITHFVFAISDMVMEHGVLILGIFFIFSFLVVILYKVFELRKKLDEWILHLPIIGDYIALAATVRFCRTTALLLNGGVTILQALNLSKGVMKNRLLSNIIHQLQERVSEGKTLSEEIKKFPALPSIVHQMLSIGEETGKISFMLQNIASICEEDLEKRLQRFVVFLQPVLLLVLGFIVGFVLLSILIPLTDVGSVF